MPTYKLISRSTGKQLNVVSATEKTPEELSQIMLQQNAQIPQEIKTPQTFTRERRLQQLETLPEKAGQFVGGLAGFGTGLIAGHPYAGMAMGGTAGRGLGLLAKEQAQQAGQGISKIQQSPDIATKAAGVGKLTSRILTDIPPFYPKTLTGMLPETRGEISKEIGRAAIGEAISAPLALLGVRTGRNIMKSLLGERVAERGITKGWKNLLKPEFYKDRIPKDVSVKMDKFFKKTTDATGKTVSEAISKYKNRFVDIDSLRQSVFNLLPKGKTVFDLEASPIQKTRISQVIQKITGKTQRKISIPKLWETRKAIDGLINEYAWSTEAQNYLRSFRNIINTPIKNAGSDVAKAFNIYSGIKNAEQRIGDIFKSIFIGDESFSPRLENFVKNLLSTNKDETIRLLSTMDDFLKKPDKIVQRLLDYAGAEQLSSEAIGFGPVQKLLLRLFGGTKTNVARVGAFAQTPILKGTGKAIRRILPIGLTEMQRKK